MAPPRFGHDDPRHRHEYVAVLRLRERLSVTAITLLIVALVLGVALTASRTEPAACTVGMTRFFQVDPRLSQDRSNDAAGVARDTKVVGGVRQALRALQTALGLPLVDLADGPQHGQWWAVTDEARQLQSLQLEDGRHLRVVSSSSSNATRVIFPDVDPCAPETDVVVEPSVSTDTDSFSVRHRDWKTCNVQHESTGELMWRQTTVRIESNRRHRLSTSADIVRLFPGLRKDVAPGRKLKTMSNGFVSVAVLTNYDVVARVHVIASEPGNVIERPEIVSGIVVSFDVSMRHHNRLLDSAMRKASHRVQDLLGRGVIRRDASETVASLALISP